MTDMEKIWFLHICHKYKTEISPHDRFVSTWQICLHIFHLWQISGMLFTLLCATRSFHSAQHNCVTAVIHYSVHATEIYSHNWRNAGKSTQLVQLKLIIELNAIQSSSRHISPTMRLKTTVTFFLQVFTPGICKVFWLKMWDLPFMCFDVVALPHS